MKRLLFGALVSVIAMEPGISRCAEVTRYLSAESGALSEDERTRWDLRLRRWLEDRRVATAAKPGVAGEDAIAPWRALLRNEGEPWDKLGTPLARQRAVQIAWQAFRTGRRARANEILEAASRRGPAEPLVVPWDWSDPEAFLPIADAFASRLARAPTARCRWNVEATNATWLDGAMVDGSVPLAEGLHAVVVFRDGQWREGSVRCLPSGVPQASPLRAAPAALPLLPVTENAPVILSLWTAGGVDVVWLTGSAVHRLTDETLDRSVALDVGGGPLAGLRLPDALERFQATTTIGNAERAAESSGGKGVATKSSPWGLWLALGAAAALGAGLYLSQRENGRQGLSMPVQWD